MISQLETNYDFGKLWMMVAIMCLGLHSTGCRQPNVASPKQDLMVPLGYISGDNKEGQRELVRLLKANGVPFGGIGSKVYQIDVPANKAALAANILRTNRLVLDRKFILNNDLRFEKRDLK